MSFLHVYKTVRPEGFAVLNNSNLLSHPPVAYSRLPTARTSTLFNDLLEPYLQSLVLNDDLVAPTYELLDVDNVQEDLWDKNYSLPDANNAHLPDNKPKLQQIDKDPDEALDEEAADDDRPLFMEHRTVINQYIHVLT
jgi:hypothetical protein